MDPRIPIVSGPMSAGGSAGIADVDGRPQVARGVDRHDLVPLRAAGGGGRKCAGCHQGDNDPRFQRHRASVAPLDQAQAGAFIAAARDDPQDAA